MKQQVSITPSRLLPFLVLMLFVTRSFAALPDALSYQGYLTNAGGTPLDTTISITFRLYNVVSGGPVLWMDTQSVTIANGLFSVKLGHDGNPLPETLFDNPVWLGIEVDTDGEMIPRKALTSVGFAFRAQQVENDADTLSNLSCATDQVAKWDGTAWACANDTDTDTNILASLVCAGGQIPKFDGSTWVCSNEAGGSDTSCSDGDVLGCYSGLDTTLSIGVCAAGYRVCSGGAYGDCVNEVLPSAELCDGLDNNCDGTADEGFNLLTDIQNCGSCGNDCNELNWTNVASYLCSTGACAIGNCAANTQDQDGNPNNGCEVNCLPSGQDVPDNNFFDADCDGIDGGLAISYFVSPLGSDSASGTSTSEPFATIQHAINAAAASGTRKHVLIAAGTYNESPVVADGVSLFGQYDPTNWSRSAQNISIVSASGAIGMSVNGYSATGYIEGLTIRSSLAVTEASSRALVLQNVTGSLSVRYNSLEPGDGRDGIVGISAPPATNTTDIDGQGGVLGCDGCSSGGSGGGPGTSSCGAHGGYGGSGGYDSDGEDGGQGFFSGTSGGIGGTVSSGCSIQADLGDEGTAGGVATEGMAGTIPVDQAKGWLAGNDWYAKDGNSGGGGSPGHGGGGGGGGGGGITNSIICFADRGGGGGGGGAGGCGGNGGTGGTGGGGSIAVLAISADGVTLTDNAMITGNGGHGGFGGDGGSGSPGGIGGNPGQGFGDAGNGGRGGDGSDGGQGGGGAGGGGGMSVGVLRSNSPGLTIQNNSFTPGTPGNGGQGGLPNGTDGVDGINLLEVTY